MPRCTASHIPTRRSSGYIERDCCSPAAESFLELGVFGDRVHCAGTPRFLAWRRLLSGCWRLRVNKKRQPPPAATGDEPTPHLAAINRFSARSTRNVFRGGITVVALYSVITAGPCSNCPEAKLLRS